MAIFIERRRYAGILWHAKRRGECETVWQQLVREQRPYRPKRILRDTNTTDWRSHGVAIAATIHDLHSAGGLLAPQVAKAELLSEFVRWAHDKRLMLLFYNMVEDDLPLLHDFGFQATKWGEEALVDLSAATWSGRASNSNPAIIQGWTVMAEVNYNRVARVYEALGYLYSGRQIFDAKASQIEEIRPRDRVLYAGVGPGEDAVLAAHRGAHVTCIDISSGMLRQATRRVEREGLNAEFVHGDVLDHDRYEYYDVVIVNFFLNVFSEQDMRRMLCHLATLARFGGKVLISDFMPPEGNAWSRAAQASYWGVTNLFYYLLHLSAWHPVYDYPAYFDAAGLELQSIRRFRPLKAGPLGFWSVTAARRL